MASRIGRIGLLSALPSVGYTPPGAGDFESTQNSFLSWTAPGAPTSTMIGSFSAWVYRESAIDHALFSVDTNPSGGAVADTLGLAGVGDLYAYTAWGADMVVSGDAGTPATSTGVWYHVVFAWDTTSGTAELRMRGWIDGAECTWDTNIDYPALNEVIGFGANGLDHFIGRNPNAGSDMDGLLCELVYVDGQALTPSSFATAGLPINLGGLTWGNNGFWLPDPSDGLDISGNDNNWTVTNVTSSAVVPS